MHVAMKRFRPKNIIQELDIQLVFERERNNLAIISTWKHCRILEFLGSFEVSDTKYGHFNLIFPYAEGGDLHSFLRLDREPQWLTDYHSGKYTVYEAICKEITGLAEAVAFIHGIKNTMYAVHRDIKPNNIFIHESKFKLGDFGLSRLKDCEESSKSEWLAGTRMYNPPERDFQEKHGRARDVWALGCVILELIVLLEHGWKKPAAVDAFQQARMRSTPQRVRAFSQTMKCVREWIARLEDNGAQIRPIGAMLRVVRKMLDPDPQTRCTAHEAARDFGDEMFHIEMFHTENYGQGRSAPGVLPSGE
jgi:serine/threonine protein kinase